MRIKINNIETFYQSIGGKNQDTLLLLHGWGNNWEAWSPLIPALSQKYKLLIPDLPGFGQSESPNSGWDMNHYVNWLRDFLEKTESSRLAGVVGHSFGGKLAAWSWLGGQEAVFPKLDNGLFLISPSGIINELTLPRKSLQLALNLIPRSIKRGILGSARRFVYTKLLNETDYYSASAFQESTLNLILQEDLRSVVSRSDVPIRLCWGENDLAVPAWMSYEFAALSSNSDVFILPRTGHFPHHEHTQLVLNWLRANKI